MINKDEFDDIFISLAMSNQLPSNEKLYDSNIDNDYFFNLTDDILWKIEAQQKNRLEN